MKNMKAQNLRTLSVLVIGAIIILGFITKIGIGNLSAVGIKNLSLICPLGAVETAIAAKLLIPRALIPFLIGVILIIIFGRFFCSWVCPMPLLQRWFPGLQAKEKAAKDAADAEHIEAVKVDDAAVTAAQATVEEGAKKANSFTLDSGTWVLAGALVSTAIFGFPVFCLVCPVGLTFASILAFMRLFQFGETTISVLLFPAILLAEVLLLRKWCQKICPLGALISIIAGLNKFFRPTIDDSKCIAASKGINCQICHRACPQGIDPARPATSEVGLNNCTKCRECADACPYGAISFPFMAEKKAEVAAPAAE